MEGDLLRFDVLDYDLNTYIDEDVQLFRMPMFIWGDDLEKYKGKMGDQVPNVRICERGAIFWNSTQVFKYGELFSPNEWGAPFEFEKDSDGWGILEE